jgi:hypothetical protein
MFPTKPYVANIKSDISKIQSKLLPEMISNNLHLSRKAKVQPKVARLALYDLTSSLSCLSIACRRRKGAFVEDKVASAASALGIPGALHIQHNNDGLSIRRLVLNL